MPASLSEKHVAGIGRKPLGEQIEPVADPERAQAFWAAADFHVMPQGMHVFGHSGRQGDGGVFDAGGLFGRESFFVDLSARPFAQFLGQKPGVGGETGVVQAWHGEFSQGGQQLEANVVSRSFFEGNEKV